jgi:hypothetical protein
MKQTIYFVILFCFGCYNSDKKNLENKINDSLDIKKELLAKTNYVHLEKLTITGDFDGDGKADTLFQNTINKNTKVSIDSFPNNQWDSLETYFYKIDADVILTLSNRKCDTLKLGATGGLYCLINIGDNNKDKKDEIAFVVNYYNFTNITSCCIFTLCDNKWKQLKEFKIHENAFEYEGDTVKTFKQIKGFLEYRKKSWFYIDYIDWFNAESDKDTILKPLKIKNGC